MILKFNQNFSTTSWKKSILSLACVVGMGACSATVPPSGEAFNVPKPIIDNPAGVGSNDSGQQTAVLAGGCFWGLEAVFEHVKGVQHVWSGYSGGEKNTASYAQVSDGNTGHAEAVKIVFDPKQVSYGQLLQVYFSVATNPTELNRQGPDTGTQYRSEIFYTNTNQKKVAMSYIQQLSKAKTFNGPIVTKVEPLTAFYPAESYHQDYARIHPDNSYIVANDAPKVVNLKFLLPGLYKSTGSL